MKRIILVCVLWFTSGGLSAQEMDYTQYVNPFIGTGGHGHTFPGATTPFGMVQLSADTRVDGSWDGCSGYHYSDSIIYGFSHTHLSGTGCSDYGDIMLMPMMGAASFDKKIYSSKYSHKNESASAGYYSVKLLDDNIDVELTATTRVGFHKYIFNTAGTANIILDLTHRDKLLQGEIKIIDDKTIDVFRRSQAWAKDQYVYSRIIFSKPFIVSKEIKNEKAAFQFSVVTGDSILVKVSLSAVDYEGAKKNLEAELPGWDFEKVKTDARAAWNKELSKIEISGGSKEQLTIFYTALYHCFIQPNIYSDVDHRYRGRDNQIHTAENFNYYTVFSLWDTFRAWHPLMTIIDRKRSSDFMKTFLAQYEQGGLLPVWELSSNETECMIGYHSVSAIADAAVKGISDFDLEKIFEAMKKSAEAPERFGLDAYMAKGFIETDDENESVSKTLEYCYDDWCIAQVAKKLGKENDYKKYMLRSQGWKNLVDWEKHFIRPRKNGGWYEPFDPYEVNNNYTEANAWQYNFFVPHDVEGLIEKFGGTDEFDLKLDELFSSSSVTTGREQSDISGMIGQYAHGNEPSHHMAYLYTYINKPWKTEQIVQMILSNFYKNSPDGLIGNEDCGQMSAWYVLSALGMYPVCPGNPEFILAAPLFPEAKIHLENGKTFIIKAEKASAKNFYVKGRMLNDSTYKDRVLPYDKILNGGILKANMSSSPDYNVFVNADTVKKNSSGFSESIITAPLIISSKTVFRDSINVEIKHPGKNVKIFTSLNNGKFEPGNLNFKIDSSAVVKAYAIRDDGKKSSTVTAMFHRIPHPNWKVNLISKYSPQYSAGGDEAAIDGLRGSEDWRKGNWQGYQSQDFECVIDLGEEKTITKISAGFLQDLRAWILLPRKVIFEISKDGTKFSRAEQVENKVSEKDEKVQTKDFTANIKKQKARYVKVKAINYGKLPSWHTGAGSDAWIFVDEVVVE
jgi:predicted alpha-1,2-mannosidase